MPFITEGEGKREGKRERRGRSWENFLPIVINMYWSMREHNRDVVNVGKTLDLEVEVAMFVSASIQPWQSPSLSKEEPSYSHVHIPSNQVKKTWLEDSSKNGESKNHWVDILITIHHQVVCYGWLFSPWIHRPLIMSLEINPCIPPVSYTIMQCIRINPFHSIPPPTIIRVVKITIWKQWICMNPDLIAYLVVKTLKKKENSNVRLKNEENSWC